MESGGFCGQRSLRVHCNISYCSLGIACTTFRVISHVKAYDLLCELASFGYFLMEFRFTSHATSIPCENPRSLYEGEWEASIVA